MTKDTMTKDKQTSAARPAAPDDTDAMLNTVEEAVQAVAAGELIIVVDDCDRENEGDLIMAASLASPERVAFMVRHTSGILCTPVLADEARRLRLSSMVQDNDAPLQTAFTVSVDYRYGLTTGISAEERTSTIRALANGNAGPDDFVRPGHVFPLISKEGGVLVRSGHTEAATDLARLAGLPPVGVVAELVNDDGSVKRLPALIQFAEEHGLKIISIADLIAHRQRRERLVERVAEFEVVTEIGTARGVAYSTPFDSVQHLALIFGNLDEGKPVPVRIHRESILKDVFASRARPEDDFISQTLRRFEKDGRGVLIYLREGSSGVPASVLYDDETHAVTEDTPSRRLREEEWREVGVGAQILRELGVASIKLIAARHRHYVGLTGFGIDLVATELLGQ